MFSLVATLELYRPRVSNFRGSPAREVVNSSESRKRTRETGDDTLALTPEHVTHSRSLPSLALIGEWPVVHASSLEANDGKRPPPCIGCDAPSPGKPGSCVIGVGRRREDGGRLGA